MKTNYRKENGYMKNIMLSARHVFIVTSIDDKPVAANSITFIFPMHHQVLVKKTLDRIISDDQENN